MSVHSNPFKQPPPWLPTTAVVQASGSTYCPDPDDPQTGFTGTLGVRVSQSPEVGYTFVAPSHCFPDDQTTFQWLYKSGSDIRVGPTGKVIARKYQMGPSGPTGDLPLLDCALIKLDSTAPKDIASGVLQGTQPPRVIKGKGVAAPGTLVSIYGVSSGPVYGLVLPPFTELDKVYDSYLFLIQLCNETGHPMCGDFGVGGDSGAVVMDKNGYVLGMYIGNAASEPGSRVGVATRFAQVEAALGVTLSPEA